MPDTPIGTRFGSYEVIARLGQGGMGDVYRARDARLGRDVAIKVMPAAFLEDAERSMRFRREAMLLASLQHPQIATLFGIEENSGQLALVMELVEGQTLEKRMAEGPMPMSEAIPVFVQIAAALEAAHEKAIVHRDLKPANVMLTPDGNVKLLDFGLAKAVDPAPRDGSSPSLSHSPTITFATAIGGALMGTAAYMAPEQARGRPVDKRADIWSFGVMFFEALSGRRLFEGQTISDTIAAVLRHEIDWGLLPPHEHPGLRRLIERCLQRDPNVRQRDMGDVRIELEELRRAPAPKPVARSRFASLPWILLALLLALFAIERLVPTRKTTLEVPRPIQASIPLPGDLQPVWGAENQEQVVAISPDGSKLAFVLGNGPEARLYLRELATAEAVPITGTERATAPVFSPDGESIAFVSDGKLRRRALAGGVTQTICDAGLTRGIAWPVDDTIVLAASFNAGLSRVRASGGTPEPLTTLAPDGTERTHRWPTVLPDSDTVLFTVGEPTKAGNYEDSPIDAVSIKTGKRWNVTQGASQAIALPNGDLLLSHRGTLSRGKYDMTSGKLIGTPLPVLESVFGEPRSGVTYAAVAKNGTLAFFSGERGIVRRRVLRADRSSGKAEPLDMPVAEYKSVRVSPDGRSIAVNEGPGGGARSDIWIYDLSRRNAIRLTTDQVLSPPIWRPDGKAVITACCDGQFLSIDADGRSAPRKIVKVDNLFGDYAVASITPDGSTLLVVTATGKTRGDILSINLASGSQAHSVFDSAAAEFEPALSPDGRWIAFGTEAEGGNINLQVEPYPDGGGRWPVNVEGVRLVTSPHWAANGRELFFIANLEIWGVPVEPGANFGMGKPYRVLERHEIIENNFGDSRYDVTPDGKAFVMIVEQTDKVRPPRLEIVLNSISKIEAVGK